MRFALNDNNHKVTPAFSGQKAICPLCGNTVIAKCGTIYIWHWQHTQETNCDPWKEHETDWHRDWKAMFPKEWQEVIIHRNNEKHIADILTDKSLVIEFQNSPISPFVIEVRERFYSNMIWVINAEKFKDNFSMRSKVNQQLRQLDRETSSKIGAILKYEKEEKSNIENKRSEKAVVIKELNYRLEASNRLTTTLQQHHDNIEETLDSILKSWEKKSYYWIPELNDIQSAIETNYKHTYLSIIDTLKEIDRKKAEENKQLEYINELETISLDQHTRKMIDYSQITGDNYSRVVAIKNSTRNTFFPQVEQIKDLQSFHQFKYQQKEYTFAINIKPTTDRIANALTSLENEIVNQTNDLSALKADIKQSLFFKLVEKQKEKMQENEDIQTAINEAKSQQEYVDRLNTKKLSQMGTDSLALASEIERDKQKRRFNIMSTQKGMYQFSWKHERKSWRQATASLFFDCGDGYLFEKVDDDLFRKITKTDFINKNNPNS